MLLNQFATTPVTFRAAHEALGHDALERFIAYLRSMHKCTSKAQGEYLSMTFDDPINRTISAHQTRYATDLLEDLGMGNCIPRLSPLPAGHTLLGADESELLAPEAAARYRTGVGKIGYLLRTKPELCFACACCAW